MNNPHFLLCNRTLGYLRNPSSLTTEVIYLTMGVPQVWPTMEAPITPCLSDWQTNRYSDQGIPPPWLHQYKLHHSKHIYCRPVSITNFAGW